MSSTVASTSLGPEETRLVGQWLVAGDTVRPDAVAERISALVRDRLVRIGSDRSGWDTLYRDPSDGRLWELTYPQSELHGGGPPSLNVIAPGQAAQKYGAVVPSNTSVTTIPNVIARFAGQDTRLIDAARSGDVRTLRVLLAEGVDVNDADAAGTTALIMASSAGHLEAVEHLLKAGADTSLKNRMGYDAHHAAMFHGDFRGAPVEPYGQIMALVKNRG